MWEFSRELKDAFPSYLKEDILYIEKNTRLKSIPNYDVQNFFAIVVNNEILQIPERHNIKKLQQQKFLDRILKKEIVLNKTQKAIIDCFYTRHCDGYIREQHCKNIIQLNHEWVVPYVFRLVGEYVIEILYLIHSNLEQMDLSIYRTFIQNNEKFYELTKQRVQSYWNCHYRSQYPKKEDYPGFKILDFFDKKTVGVIT